MLPERLVNQGDEASAYVYSSGSLRADVLVNYTAVPWEAKVQSVCCVTGYTGSVGIGLGSFSVFGGLADRCPAWAPT